jgi:Tfp pilus assembly protein PilO
MPGWFRKEGVLPVALGLATLGVASYFLLFAPELRVIRSLRAEIAAKDAEVAEAMRLRSEVAQFRMGEGAQWEEQLRVWERRVPSTPDTEHLLSEIGDMAVRHNLKFFGLAVDPVAGTPQAGGAPDPAVAEGAPVRANPEAGVAEEARFRLTFRASYRDLAEFLDEIPRARRLLTIRSVTVKEKADAMTAEIEMSAWHRRAR